MLRLPTAATTIMGSMWDSTTGFVIRDLSPVQISRGVFTLLKKNKLVGTELDDYRLKLC